MFFKKSPTSPGPTPVRHNKRLWILVIVFGFIAAVAGSGWLVLGAKQHGKKDQATATIRSALDVNTVDQSTKTITSDLGFSVDFNATVMSAYGKIITSPTYAEVYTGEEVLKPNSYAIVELGVKKTVTSTGGVELGFTPSLNILTNANRDFFETRRKNGMQGSDLDITIAHYAPKKNDIYDVALVGRDQETFGGITYEKITYKLINPKIPHLDETNIHYVTVQNSRPFVLSVSLYAYTKEGDATPVYQAIETIQYTQPKDDARWLSLGEDRVSLKNKEKNTFLQTYVLGDATVPSDSINIPNDLKTGTDISVVARNQLAVVRVGTINCYDFDLLLPSGATSYSLKDACAAGVGSGSIISDKGLISTNGHVAKVAPSGGLMLHVQFSALAKNYKPIEDFGKYIVDKGLATSAESAQLVSSVKSGDTKALQSLSALALNLPSTAFRVSREADAYAIQLSNEPIRMTAEGTKPAFIFTDDILEASYIDADYAGQDSDLTAKASDVALLKVTKEKTFPVIRLGSIEGLKKSDLVTVVGFPSFVDGGLTTKQSKTVPSATQGSVLAIDSTDGTHKLVRTDVPIAQGNSGGPAFDQKGQQIGLATYVIRTTDPELGVSKFGRVSLLRDVADLKALVAKNNITLSGTSTVSSAWNKAIDDFEGARYSSAINGFKKVEKDYGEHYLASALTEAAEDKQGTGDDASSISIAAKVLAVILLLSALSLPVFIFLLIRSHARSKHVPPQFPPAYGAP